MVRAVFNGRTIAESDDTVVIEGRHYFPADSVDTEVLRPSEHTSRCFWKGTASYWSVEVDGESATDAMWRYEDPMAGAEVVAGRVAFWRGVEVSEDAGGPEA